MFYQPILTPMLTLVALTVLVWVYMYITRFAEIGRKAIDAQALSTRSKGTALLVDSAAPADNFKNLFELPVLFYIAVLLSLILLIQDQTLVLLAWTFVILRCLHSLVHCTYNRVIHRFVLYLLSSLALFVMWARLAAYILTQ